MSVLAPDEVVVVTKVQSVFLLFNVVYALASDEVVVTKVHIVSLNVLHYLLCFKYS